MAMHSFTLAHQRTINLDITHTHTQSYELLGAQFNDSLKRPQLVLLL